MCEIIAISSEKELAERLKEYEENVEEISKLIPDKYTAGNKGEILSIAQEIKYRDLFYHSNKIERTEKRAPTQTIYYAKQDGKIVGMINCMASSIKCLEISAPFCVNCKSKKCLQLNIPQLSGISGGGSYLLMNVIEKAFSKKFNVVCLTPAATKGTYNKAYLINYYRGIAKKLEVEFAMVESDCYYYKKRTALINPT